MPNLFRYPPCHVLNGVEVAERWTPEQIRGDGVVGALNPSTNAPPRRGPGPSWETLLTEGARRHCNLSNWTPASAGVVAVSERYPRLHVLPRRREPSLGPRLREDTSWQ
ncbi:hypothetical protein HMP09_2201 [Sphingomonas sp. HMP9]|nr:hypothetical protein HMP09_2201 [Sphingomonas sp. HMP9]